MTRSTTKLAEGHVALVTGAGSGIGRATAHLFAEEGARVVCVDLLEASGEETAAAIRDLGREAVFVRADVTDEDSVRAMVTSAIDRYGRLDSAFNNAGISDSKSRLHELTYESWQKMIAVNLSGVFLCMKYEIAQMLEQEPVGRRRGAIVNTSSGAGFIAAPGMPHYTAAKHGVLGMVKNAAQDYYTDGIRVNAICPGLTDTPMVADSLEGDSDFARRIRASLPGGEAGRPEDVAQAAVWLCSERARWINGEPMLVDGGSVSR